MCDLIALITLFATFAGCGGRTVGEDESYVDVAVGRIADSDAVVAVVRDGGGSVAYVCGGATTFDRWTRWYQGNAAEDVLFNDGWAFEIDAAGGSGVVREPEGTEHVWVASSDSRDAALYTKVDAGCRTGVVVGGGVGAQGVWCDDRGRFAQVTPVRPIDIDRFDVRVVLPEGERALVVERAATTALAP